MKPVKQRFPPPANQTRDAMEKRGGKSSEFSPKREFPDKKIFLKKSPTFFAGVSCLKISEIVTHPESISFSRTPIPTRLDGAGVATFSTCLPTRARVASNECREKKEKRKESEREYKKRSSSCSPSSIRQLQHQHEASRRTAKSTGKQPNSANVGSKEAMKKTSSYVHYRGHLQCHLLVSLPGHSAREILSRQDPSCPDKFPGLFSNS